MTEERTFGAWCDIYSKILDTRPIKRSTLRDKHLWMRHMRGQFEERNIESILPFELAQLSDKLKNSGRESSARCVIVTAKDLFYEALLANWVLRNPAEYIRRHRPRVKRHRLSLENWHLMRAFAIRDTQPHARLLLDLALVSGQRSADLAAMEFAHIWDDHLHVEQQKTGRRIALPLLLTLEGVGLNLGNVIDQCRRVGAPGSTLLRFPNGRSTSPSRLSTLFRNIRASTIDVNWTNPDERPSLHETRSLAERLYRKEGLDTQALMGHKYPMTTFGYNDDRGLDAKEWKRVGPALTPYADARKVDQAALPSAT